MNSGAARFLLGLLVVALASCGTPVLYVNHTFLTGPVLSAAETQKLVAAGVPVTTKTATDWCTNDPLPAGSSTVTSQEKIFGESNFYWVDPAPKRVWCFAKDEGAPVFLQCQLTRAGSSTNCLNGEHFNITASNAGGPTPAYHWVSFSDAQTGKVRVSYVVWER